MTQDTRKDPRAKIVSLNVRYKSATVDEFIDNHSHDVSKGGIFIKTANPFPPGTLLKFEIRIAGDKAVIAGVGRVVWKREAAQSNSSEQPAGMGVKFIKIDDPSRAIIDRLVDTKGGARSAYEEGGGDGPPVPAKATVVATKDARKSPSKPASVAATRPPAALPKPQPAPARSTSIGPKAGKSTVMGLGNVAGGTITGKATLSVPTPAAGRPADDDARRPAAYGVGVPRPASSPAPPLGGRARGSSSPAASEGGGMFPKTDSKGDMPPTGEQTVMKQAAELLEEALRGAGGSMEEIGQNPLFDQISTKTKDAESAAALAKLKQPSSLEHSSTVHGLGPQDVDELMKPIAELEEAAAAERVRRSSAPPARSPSGPPAPTRGSTGFTTSAPKASPSVRPPSAVAAVEGAPPKNRWLLPVLLVAAAGGLGFFAYTQTHATPAENSTLAPIPPPSPSASAAPSAQPSAPAPAPSASAEPNANGGADAAAAITDASSADAARGTSRGSSSPVATAAPVAPWHPPPRKPAATAAPAPPETDPTDPTTPRTPGGSVSATPTASAPSVGTDIPGTAPVPTASIPKPTPVKPGTKSPSDDDNP
jgi:uncharacterized protein (TIGR02266 family)